MRGLRRESRLSVAMVACLLGVLVALALLQNRWIAQLSNAERDRLRSDMETASARFCDDFDRELTCAFQSFQFAEEPPDEELAGRLATRLARWRSTAPFPGFVRELLVVRRIDGEPADVSRFDEGTGRLRSCAWDDGLESVRRTFQEHGRVPLLDELLPGLVLPVRRSQPPHDSNPPDLADQRPPRDHVIVRLDIDFIRREFLPRLAARGFGGGDGLAYAVQVAVADQPARIIFAAGPRVEAAARVRAETEKHMFALRSFPDLTVQQARDDSEGFTPARPGDRDDRRGADDGQRSAPPPVPDSGGARDRPGDDGSLRPPAGVEVGRWLLEVRHPSGSLEAAVAGARRRNLAISLAITALLGAVGVLMVVSTRRAQRLARQQMDFVASVSHELRTPLTAMRSAGQNLADGIVNDPERVKNYGALIEREGRRLTEMVSRVLAFAGIRSGQPTYRMHPVAVRELIDGVLSDSRWVLEEKRFEVEAHVAADLPAVRGDSSALRQALSNLVDNAMKYGAAARWIGVRAEAAATERGDEVAIAVSDGGPGIRRSDLAHLFEPFFRGSDAQVAATPGSGLGLAVVRSIVEAHGGRITVSSAPGRGSTFTIHLPAAPDTGKGGAR